MIDLVIDIETIPDQREGALEVFIKQEQENFSAPSGLTKEQAAADLGMTNKDEIKYTSKDAMISLWVERFRDEKAPEVAEQKWRKTALDGSRGEIAVIGYALAIAGDPKSKYRDTKGSEQELLERFFAEIEDLMRCMHCHGEQIRFIGHNIEAFDLRFLWQRAVINNVEPPCNLTMSRYSDRLFDTMTQWAGYGNRISLDSLCKALNVPSPKSEIDGSMVWDYVRDGRILEVSDYCMTDVTATRLCFQKMTFNH